MNRRSFLSTLAGLPFVGLLFTPRAATATPPVLNFRWSYRTDTYNGRYRHATGLVCGNASPERQSAVPEQAVYRNPTINGRPAVFYKNGQRVDGPTVYVAPGDHISVREY